MGIRFACHQCGKRLNIKRELAGRRGVCPECSARFRIPLNDAEASLPADEKPWEVPSIDDASAPQRSASAHGASGSNVPQRDHAAEAAHSTRKSSSETERAGDMEFGGLDRDEAEATWYVRPPSGGQYGPASTDLLHQWIEEGRVAATSLLWRDGWPQWRTAVEALPDWEAKLPGGGKPAASERAASISARPAGAGVLDGAGQPVAPRPASRDERSAVEVSGPAATFSDRAAEFSGEAATFSGEANVGAQRRMRSHRRVMWIGLLSAVALMLVGVLVVVASRG